MFTGETTVRVRYAETDQMGYVYYGNYAMYYEVARAEALREIGFPYAKLEGMGIMMPVLENKSKYLIAGRYDELLTIKMRIPKLPMVKIIVLCDIYNEQNELINQGETILAFVDMKTRKPCRIPDAMKAVLEPLYAED